MTCPGVKLHHVFSYCGNFKTYTVTMLLLNPSNISCYNYRMFHFHQQQESCSIFPVVACPDAISPPQNISTAQHNMPSTTIEWDAPVITGGSGVTIVRYRITIQSINYSEEENCTESKCSHTITADGSGVRFNTPYLVEMIAVNTLGEESSGVSITVTIQATGWCICTY